MMTRKDFEEIAKTLDANFAPLSLVLDFANMLEETNPRFDRVRFVRASTNNIEKDLSIDSRMLARALNGKA